MYRYSNLPKIIFCTFQSSVKPLIVHTCSYITWLPACQGCCIHFMLPYAEHSCPRYISLTLIAMNIHFHSDWTVVYHKLSWGAEKYKILFLHVIIYIKLFTRNIFWRNCVFMNDRGIHFNILHVGLCQNWNIVSFFNIYLLGCLENSSTSQLVPSGMYKSVS